MNGFLERTTGHSGRDLARGTEFGRRLGSWLVLAYRRRQQRRALGQLDDRLLRDIGIDREDVLLEAAKPFWR